MDNWLCKLRPLQGQPCRLNLQKLAGTLKTSLKMHEIIQKHPVLFKRAAEKAASIRDLQPILFLTNLRSPWQSRHSATLQNIRALAATIT